MAPALAQGARGLEGPHQLGARGQGLLVAGELDGAAALGFHGLAQAALGQQRDQHDAAHHEEGGEGQDGVEQGQHEQEDEGEGGVEQGDQVAGAKALLGGGESGQDLPAGCHRQLFEQGVLTAHAAVEDRFAQRCIGPGA